SRTERYSECGLNNKLVTEEAHYLQLNRREMEGRVESGDKAEDLIHRYSRCPLFAEDDGDDRWCGNRRARTEWHDDRHQLTFAIDKNFAAIGNTAFGRTCDCR